MANVVLDYAVKFNQIDSLPVPSTDFLHSLCIVAPVDGTPSTGTVLVGTRDGDLVTPATIEFKGGLKTGDTVAMQGMRDSDGIFGAEYSYSTDVDYLQAATEFGDFLAGNIGITVNVVDGGAGVQEATVEILASGDNTTVSILGVEVRRVNTTRLVEIDETQLDDVLPSYADQVQGAFDGGLSKATIAFVEDITDLPGLLDGQETEFYTVFALPVFSTTDFLDNSISWEGVRGFVTNSDTDSQYVILTNTCGFMHQGNTPLNAYNPLRAFGELLSASLWRNQQYVQSTLSDGTVTTVGRAEALFADRFSFWMSDATTGIVLGFFVAGGESITTPYIVKELELLMQADMTNYLAVNQPFNTTISRNQLERVGNKRIVEFIDLSYLDPDGINTIDITESNEVFVVNGLLVTSPAVALWRVFIDSAQTQG